MHVRTRDAATRLGISYRQLDHLARTGVIDLTDGEALPGSGNHRTWDDDIVDQIAVAVALNDVIAEGAQSALPSIVGAIIRAGTPPRHGWALYTRSVSRVRYAHDIADLAEALVHLPGVIVARFDLDHP